MARSRDIEYRVGFTGDTSLLEAAVKKATESLNKLGTSPDKLRAGLDGAARSALELSNHLSTAFNLLTGKLDLIKFRQQLNASGRDLLSYAADLRKLGPEGELAFLEMASAIGKAELPLRRTNNIVKQFGVTLWNTARWRITTSAINTFVGGLQQAYGYSKSLDASLNNIRIVTGKSAEDMAAFAKQANAAAKSLSTTTTTYTDASLIYYQQGLSDELVAARTEATIKMANVTGLAAEEISSQMTAIWNNFEDGSKTLENYGDAIVALGASTAASSEEIATGLQKFAPIALTVGLSFDYASAALTTIVLNTRESATAAGTSLKTLFSRLEGLKLGETLEDGTDLNKYSNALMAVGINIKDVSGNLKDMDTILSELGAKWQTLARDQQMALAETVGGVRQYAQLVALMDNWSDFLRNLVTVLGSLGELLNLADIYAESWEAARNRVKAATEDIYDSLINPLLFIELDNLFTPLLTGIASAVDALGGLTGFLPVVVLLMTQAFGDKIAASLRNMVTNIGLMTGAEQKHARALLGVVSSLALELNLTNGRDEFAARRIEVLRQEVGLLGEVNARMESMSLAQKDLIETELRMVDILKEKALETAKIAETNRLALAEARDALALSANQSALLGNLPFNNIQLLQNAFLPANFMQNINTSIVTDFDSAINLLIDRLQLVVESGNELSILRKAFADVENVTEENIKRALELLNTYGRLPQNANDVRLLLQALTNLAREGNAAREAIQGALTTAGAGSGEIREFTTAAGGMATAASNSTVALNLLTNGIEHVSVTARASKYDFIDWADAVVAAGRAASLTAMAMRAVGNLKDIFSKDNESSLGDKLSQGLMSGAMLAPMVSGIVRKLINAKSNFTGSVINTALRESADTINDNFILGSNAAALANRARAKLDAAEKARMAVFDEEDWRAKNAGKLTYADEERYLSLLKKSTKALTEATNASIKAENALRNLTQSLSESEKLLEALSGAEETAKIASKDFAIATGVAGVAITAIVVAVALAIKSINDYKEKIRELNKEKVKEADKVKEEIKTNLGLMDSYQNLLLNYKETGEGKEELDALARELANAYHIEGAALASLTENYDAFYQKIQNANRALLKLQQQTLLEGANAAVNLNGLLGVTLDESMVLALLAHGLSLYIQYEGANQVFKITTNSYDELMRIKDTLTELQDLFPYFSSLIEGINKELAKTNDYLQEAATIEIELKTPNPSLISSFEEYQQWVSKAELAIAKFNLSSTETAGAIKLAALNLGLDEWLLISNVYEDVQDLLKYLPGLAKETDIAFSKLSNAEAEVIAYLPWSALTEDASNLDELIALTQEYVDALLAGSQAALDMATALKLLNLVSSGFKAKDLKDFAKLLGKEGLEELLSLSEEEQTAYINNFINTTFEASLTSYNNAIKIANKLLEVSLNSRLKAIQDLWNSLSLEEQIANAAGGVTAEQYAIHLAAAFEDELRKWQLALSAVKSFRTERQELLDAVTAGTLKENELSDKLKDLRDDLVNELKLDLGDSGSELITTLLGLNPDNIDTDSVEQDIYKIFTKILGDENLTRFVQANSEIGALDNSITTLSDDVYYNLLAWDNLQKKTAEAAKSLGELNKLYREGSVRGKAYASGILTLAKQIPKATLALQDYNEASNDKARADAYQQLKQIVEEDAYGQAAAQIKDATDTLNKNGLTLGVLPTNTQDMSVYNELLGKIAKAIREVTGATEESINETWVQDHANKVQEILDGNVTAILSINDSLSFALGTSSDEFKTWAESIISEGTNIANIVKALDGIDFDINGYANMDLVIKNLNNAGLAAALVVKILRWISDANIGFEVSGIETYELFMLAAQSEPDPLMAAYYKAEAVSALSIKSNALTDVPYYGSSSKGGGGGSDKEKDIKKYYRDIEDRYHEINRQIERQDRLLTKIDKDLSRAYGSDKLKLFGQLQDELNKKLELFSQKNGEAFEYLEKDKAVLQGLVEDEELKKVLFEGFDIEFGTGQEILNYDQVLQGILDRYNEFAEKYDNASKEEKENLKEQKELEDQLYQARLDALKKYEDTLNLINTIAHDTEEVLRLIADNNLEQTQYKIKVVIDLRDAKKDFNNFRKSIEESFGDLVTHGAKAILFDEKNAREEIAMYDHYVLEYNELQQLLSDPNANVDAIIGELKELEGNIISSGEALLEWIDTVENMYADTLKDAADRFEEFTNQIAHDTDIIGMIKELYSLLGVTYKTLANFNKLVAASEAEYNGYLRLAELNKQWYDNAAKRLAEAEAALAKVDENDVNYDALKKNRDALLEEANKTQKALLENAKSAMETARQMYLDSIDKFAYDVEQRLTLGLGFDLLQDKYDHFIETSERYLDPIEEGLESASWYSKLDASIQETTNKAYKERLLALKDEVDLRRENNTLSQYDLDIIEAKYLVLQAEMALEDARNNKNQLRLVRDGSGNWNYRYTADTGDIADKEQDLLKARLNEYEITKNRYKELNSELLQMTLEWAEKDKKIRLDVANNILTAEEGAARLDELKNYYETKVKYLRDELGIAVEDMDTAALYSAELVLQVSTNAYDTSGLMLNDLKTTFVSQLDDMTRYLRNNFESAVEEYMGNALNAFNEFNIKVDETRGLLGIGPDNLNSLVNTLNSEMDTLYYEGGKATEALYKQIDTVGELQLKYLLLNKEVQDYINKLSEIGGSVVGTIESASGVDTNTFKDVFVNENLPLEENPTLGKKKALSKASKTTATEWPPPAGSVVEVSGNGADRVFTVNGQSYPYGTPEAEYLQQMLNIKWKGGNSFVLRSGGYTGDWSGTEGRLALLHQKELVLNQEDTSNMLAAVEVVRAIAHALDNNALLMMGALASRMTSVPPVVPAGANSLTTNYFNVDFPNAVYANEIEEALTNLINNAEQYASGGV